MPRTHPRTHPRSRPRARASATRTDRLWTLLPGLVLTGLATAAAYGIGSVVPGINATTAAVLLGMLAAHTGGDAVRFTAGTGFAGQRLLRVAVVLLGLQLSVPALLHLGGAGLAVVTMTVAVTFVGTQLLGRMLGVSPSRSLLVATGFSICGASAVAAMEPVAGGDEEDTGTAIALVTLCGTLAIAVLPALRAPLHLDVVGFGSWVGASVHDVGQTVATANRVPGAITTAVVVKLTRVILLAPLVATVAFARRGRLVADSQTARRPAPVPVFVLGFLLAVVVVSSGIVPAGVVRLSHAVQGVLLAAALFGLGGRIRVPDLVRTGGRSLLLGLCSWILVAAVALGGVRLLGV